MPARDVFHNAVKHALEKQEWRITHDPFPVTFELGDMYIDLGAEKILAAEKEGHKIAVEVKSFMNYVYPLALRYTFLTLHLGNFLKASALRLGCSIIVCTGKV